MLIDVAVGVTAWTFIALAFHRLAFPFPLLILAAFCSSTKSLMMPFKSALRRARSKTSSVVMEVRPAWRLKLSRSIATFSDPSVRAHRCIMGMASWECPPI